MQKWDVASRYHTAFAADLFRSQQRSMASASIASIARAVTGGGVDQRAPD